MLAPIMPHFAATLWYGFTSAPGRLIEESMELDYEANILKQKWPTVAKDTNVDLIYRVSYKYSELPRIRTSHYPAQFS